MEKKLIQISKEGVNDILPHRDKMSLAKFVERCIPGEYIASSYTTRGDEWYYDGYCVGDAVLPKYIILELLIQGGAVMMLAHESWKGRLPILIGLDKISFGREVRPGERMWLEGNLEKVRGTVGFGNAAAYVDGELAASCVIKFVLVEKEELEDYKG